jgi:cyclophilin family peptidyl-prolyl cis-trans isomerase
MMAAKAASPAIGDERLVFHSNRGDIVIGLYDGVAPRHAAQLRKLVRLGVYDTTNIFRVEPGFLAQITNAQNRGKALTPEQHKAITAIPAEFSKLPHKLGTVSMARDEDEPNSAETSFSFILGRAKELDGKFTVIGEVIYGLPLLQQLAKEPILETKRPASPVVIDRAEVKTAAELAAMQLRGIVPLPKPVKSPKPVSKR